MAATPTGPRHGGIVPPEWPGQAADAIVDTIAKVRDRTTKPAIVAARGLVYGLMALIVGHVAAVLLLIVVVHMWDNWFPGHVWVLYAILFVAFSTAGLILLRKANAPAAELTTDA